MKKIVALQLMLLVTLVSWGHPWKPSHYVIVDTDGGLDDMKAICMLLASPDVRVLAITTSDGYQTEQEAFNRVRKMLDSFHHEGVTVALSNISCDVISQALENEATPVTFISLGSLKTVSNAIKRVPDFRKKVKQIIWTNDGAKESEGFNYKAAPEAAMEVLRDSVPIMIAGGGGEGFYDKATVSTLKKVNSRYAQKITAIIGENSNHAFVYTAYDEMAPLLLHYPSLFTTTIHEMNNHFAPKDISALRQASIKILSGETVNRMQVMKSVPSDTSFYMTDLQPIVTEVIKKYGDDEWASGVIANELHRHLGVFAIVGVKMGIRAREYFCTGVDEFSVTSHAGSTPPLSCMNDGIQVSTGATPGHGLLTISPDEPFTPSAEFRYKDKTIRLTLKKEVADKLLAELKEINFVYGLDSNIYWELVRKNTIKYWQQFDRTQIFTIEVIAGLTQPE